MNIYEHTISFKSSDIFYQKEKSGIKNNTTRFLNEEERDQLLNYNLGITHIQITKTDQSEYFERKLKDISIWIRNHECIAIFTWDAI
jgi:hypothetical protein